MDDAMETETAHHLGGERRRARAWGRFVVRGCLGLHARPAALIARAAREFAAEITLALGARRADAKSVLALLTLGAAPGAEVQVVAEGQDAPEALRAIAELLQSDPDHLG
jgi:phosphotransferase system HPr (HPr) family protein